MKCPHCQKPISNKLIAAELGYVGGKKSKRKLTSEQARAMVKSRESKRFFGR